MLVFKLTSSSNQRETQLPVERKSRRLEEIRVSLKPLGISLMSINGSLRMPWSTQHASNWQPFNWAQRSGLLGFAVYFVHTHIYVCVCGVCYKIKNSRQTFCFCVICRKKWELRGDHGYTEMPAKFLIKHQTSWFWKLLSLAKRSITKCRIFLPASVSGSNNPKAIPFCCYVLHANLMHNSRVTALIYSDLQRKLRHATVSL